MDEDATLTPALEKQIQEITRWLKNPNPSKLFESILYEGVAHWGIAGNFYWYIPEDSKGRLLEIWPMHPALTKVKATKNGEIMGYVMHSPDGDEVRFDADEVLDFPLPNPTHDLYGESPLELVLEEAGIDLQALRSSKAIFQNGLNPSAVLLMDETAKPGDAKTMTEMLKASHTGSGNQHKIVALSKTKEFKPWTMTNRDLEFLKLRDLATSKVTTAYRIPKVLLGHHNAGDYATTKFLIRDTYNHVYRPMQRVIEAIMTERLIHRFNPELRFEFLTPDASDPDDIRKDQMQAKAAGILTTDEVRGDSFGKDPLEDEDKDTPTNDEQKPDKDAGDTTEDAPDTSTAITKALSDTDATTLADSREREMEGLAQAIEPSLVKFFTSQEQRYLDRLSKRALRSVVAKGVDSWVDEHTEHENDLLHALMFGLLVASLNAGVHAAQLQISMTLSTEQSNKLVQDYLKTQAAEHVKGINQTTRDRLRTTLAQGLTNRETTAELSNRISTVFADAKGYRSQAIARTETAQAYSYANEQVIETTGAVNEYQWLTASSDVCPICRPLNGARRKPGKTYPGGLKPAFAHIQCRRSEIGWVDRSDNR